MLAIPDTLRGNSISRVLDEFLYSYQSLSRTGAIQGLLVVDQDAKVLATNTHFDRKLNYWDLGAIGAALYGVAKQAKDFLAQNELERASMIFSEFLFFAQPIGQVNLNSGEKRELILLVIGERKLNLGLIILTMQRYAPKILDSVMKNKQSQEAMILSEREFRNQIETIRKDLLIFSEGQTQ